MHVQKNGSRLLLVAAAATAMVGLAGPVALAAPQTDSAGTAPGTHIPMTVPTDAMIQECGSIPADRDPAMSRIVFDTGVARQASPKAILSAMETGWVESHMNNLNCGDRDSVGVFQQRPSQGWGTPEQCMDPVHASNAYYDQAIVNDGRHPEYSAGQLAQSVQRSAFPDRYDAAQPKAQSMIDEIVNG